MNRIGKILEELSVLQGQRFGMENSVKENQAKVQVLTGEWQDMCSHPMEYLDTLEDESVKCCACGFIISPPGDA
jgi:hypothetical protein